MRVSQRAGRISGATLRCNKNRNHEIAIRTYSFFEASKLCNQDIFMFIKCYLDGLSLSQTSSFTGVHYKSTAVDWASFVRELFKEHFHRSIRHRKLTGEVEIDESLFGRRVKFHRGNPNKGLKVWVFGMVERSSNTIIVYPVENRSNAVLIPIIERHVEKGSTIYSDGWTAYCALNDLGYHHFSVLHKYSFKKEYKHVETGEIITVHTNRIEGAWKHAKDYFRKMSGTQASQWEGHLAEVMWRAEVKGRKYENFFDLLRSVYTLEGPPHYQYTTPLFDSWPGLVCSDLNNWTLQPEVTDAGSEVTTSSDEDEAESRPVERVPSTSAPSASVENPLMLSSTSDEDNLTAGQRQRSTRTLKPETVALISELFSDSSLDDTIVEPAVLPSPEHVRCQPSTGACADVRRKEGQIRKKNRTDNVCHPEGYAPTSSKPKGKRKGKSTSEKKKQKSVQ
ncbi:uncharacterized protein LOC123558376 [Mercenaria mercenaria]|uniref:uncharacterized protein LOC123558376 n=1 Tax=Mercenaria mercenaria TaxID=6596 RepID=UPI00234EA6D1|nr:uncharacterized protein LOC123558376 [Mercenaria mercenaria]